MSDERVRIQGLSADDTAWLLAEAQQILKEHREAWVVTDGVALTLPDGRILGLDNLARTLQQAPRDQWSELAATSSPSCWR